MPNNTISIKDAIAGLYNRFNRYSSAYTITNENIRWMTGLAPSTNHSILTTCGSGDQPLFYALNGATDIDTFDISINARAIMELKTAAIPNMSHDQYINMLIKMHKHLDLQSIPNTKQVISQISSDISQYISEMESISIFSNGHNVRSYPQNLPTESEYKLLQTKISKPFNFIWSDITELHNSLTKQYDIINTSNIFDYIDEDTTIETLKNLFEHLYPGGYIVSQVSTCKKEKIYTKFEKLMQGTAKVEKRTQNHQTVFMIQRAKASKHNY